MLLYQYKPRCSHILCLACVEQQALAFQSDNGDAEGQGRSVQCPRFQHKGANYIDNDVLPSVATSIVVVWAATER